MWVYKTGVKPPLFLLSLCVVGYPLNWGKRSRDMARIHKTGP